MGSTSGGEGEKSGEETVIGGIIATLSLKLWEVRAQELRSELT